MSLPQAIDLSPLTSSPAGAPLLSTPLPFLGSVQVQLLARVGEARLSVADFLAMQAGSLVPLDRLVEQPIDLLVDQHVVARGTLVAVGEHFGVRLTETPVASMTRPQA